MDYYHDFVTPPERDFSSVHPNEYGASQAADCVKGET